jgi:hypothetical protein
MTLLPPPHLHPLYISTYEALHTKSWQYISMRRKCTFQHLDYSKIQLHYVFHRSVKQKTANYRMEAIMFISPLLFQHLRGFSESTDNSELNADLDDQGA